MPMQKKNVYLLLNNLKLAKERREARETKKEPEGKSKQQKRGIRSEKVAKKVAGEIKWQ